MKYQKNLAVREEYRLMAFEKRNPSCKMLRPTTDELNGNY